MATSISNLQEVIAIGYKVENPQQVGEFLNENPFLVPFLKILSDAISTYFDERVLTLKFLTDPEISNWERLFVGITSKYELLEAVNRLNKFDSGWWFEFSQLAQDKILVDIDFSS